jgi:hypothetical protein
MRPRSDGTESLAVDGKADGNDQELRLLDLIGIGWGPRERGAGVRNHACKALSNSLPEGGTGGNIVSKEYITAFITYLHNYDGT